MERTASCCCGRVAVEVEGDPEVVIACHCDYCQQRTGSVFQVSCWYPRARTTEMRGEPKTFNDTPGNQGTNYHFCSNCGTTVYWTFDYAPNHLGIAVGCFADAEFPKPDIEMFTTYRHQWLGAIDGVRGFESFPDLEYLPALDG